MAALIFDFDGTLADSFNLATSVLYGPDWHKRIPADELKRLRSLPVLSAAARLEHSYIRGVLGLVRVRQVMAARIGEMPTFGNLGEVLAKLHADGHILYVMTSNLKRNAQAFVEARGWQELFDGLYHGNVYWKWLAIRHIVRTRQLDPAQTYYIGNEPLDVRAAHRAGVQAVAVEWSGQDHAALKATHPTAILKTPNDLLKLIQ